MIEAGAKLCELYPTGRDTSSLEVDFRRKVQSFIFRLEKLGCTVHITATRRPRSRAWLMRQAWDVVEGTTAPEAVGPAPDGSQIRWTVEGARAMVQTYGLVVRPSLNSKHIDGEAIDMRVEGWTGSRAELDNLGRSFGVYPLAGDPVHWSSNGH
jgi:hypothetical protein